MVVWNIFFTTILLPLVGVALLARRRRAPFSKWLATVILAAGMAGFGVLVAPWGWFGVPLRIAIALLFAIALGMSLRGPRHGEEIDTPPTNPFRLLLMILVGLFFGSVAIGVLRAYGRPPGAVGVAFPLTRGAYLVAQGGSHPAANYHAHDPKQSYAVDLVKLNGAAMRARGIYPDDARAYAIFGDMVISPCDGTVIAATDGLPDAARISLDEKNPAGNHVTVRCGDVDVTLAHLQRGSIAVHAGARVTRKAPLGRAGNSGTSTEPHLEIHAERNGAAVPLTFDGRWLVRNDIVRK
jgi:Peptidase family M23